MWPNDESKDRTNERDELVEQLTGEVEFLRAELSRRPSPEADDLESRKAEFAERMFEGHKQLTTINLLPLAFVVALSVGIGLPEEISIGVIAFFAASLILSLVGMALIVIEARARTKEGTQNLRARRTPYVLFISSVVCFAFAWIVLVDALR